MRRIEARVAALFALVGVAIPGGIPAQTPEPPPASQGAPAPEAPVRSCPYCLTPLGRDEFCPRCARLARVESVGPEHRAWIEAPYVPLFPSLDDPPVIEAAVASTGLLHELVQYGSGDRFDARMEKKGLVVKGKLGTAGKRKEMDYSAHVQDTLGDAQRLATREVFARAEGDPDQHLYRKLHYAYTPDGRLDRVEFKAWLYRGASDWKDKPSAWVRHNAGTIVFHREGGRLSRIETTVREATRSLRGDLEYREPRTIAEDVVYKDDAVDHIVRSHS